MQVLEILRAGKRRSESERKKCGRAITGISRGCKTSNLPAWSREGTPRGKRGRESMLDFYILFRIEVRTVRQKSEGREMHHTRPQSTRAQGNLSNRPEKGVEWKRAYRGEQ